MGPISGSTTQDAGAETDDQGPPEDLIAVKKRRRRLDPMGSVSAIR